MRAVGEMFAAATEARTRELAPDWITVEDGGAVTTRRPCRGCGVDVVLLWPDGLRPALMRLFTSMTCEGCADEEDAAEERATIERTMSKRVRDAGIPQSLAADVSWESMLTDAGNPNDSTHRGVAITAAQEWAKRKRPRKGLLIYGPAGSGKTRLAATAAMARLAHSSIRWVSVGVLMANLEASWGDRDRQAALEVLTGAGAVVLDDFDKVNAASDRVRSQLFTALQRREESGESLVVTTNLPPSKLEASFGDPIASRLTGLCVMLPFPGPDRRIEMGVGKRAPDHPS